MVSGNGRAYLQIDAPEDLNRLWFAGRVLGCTSPVGGAGDECVHDALFAALAPTALRMAPARRIQAEREWRAEWAAAREQRAALLLQTGGRDGAWWTPQGPALQEVVHAVADLFAGWWNAPTGAKLALAGLVDQITVPPDRAAALMASGQTTFVDVVGQGNGVARFGSYVQAGAHALFPPSARNVRRLLTPDPVPG